MGGDTTRLIEVANNDSNTELRRRAIQRLGMMDRQRTADAILNIYNRQTDTGLKESAIEALFIQQNAETLVALARKETDRELKARIVQRLSLMLSPAARDYMLELLK
jgi:HEAT repeat protein